MEFKNNRSPRYTLWHTGMFAGTFTEVVSREDGMTWVVLFNQGDLNDPKLPVMAIDGKLHEAAAKVQQWPTWDWFGRYRAEGRR
jgi:hypothetical protein